MHSRLACRSGPVSCRIRCCLGTLQAFRRASTTDRDPPAAHHSYEPSKVNDASTLLLMARSAAAAGYLEPRFWRACSMQIQQLGNKATFPELARFVEAAARAQYRDDELMYNFGDLAGQFIEREDADAEGVALTLRAHALIGFYNPRLTEQLERALFEMMQSSKVTATGLATSFWSLGQLSSLGIGHPPRRELIEAVGRMVQEHLTLFSAQQLVEILDGYAAYRIQGDRQMAAVLADIAGSLAQQSGTLEASQCAGAARAYAKCRVHEERLLGTIGFRLRDQEVRKSLVPVELAGLLYGLAKFTCQDVALLDLLSIEARKHLHDMDVPTLSSILASLAKAGVSSPVLSSRAASRLKQIDAAELAKGSMQDLIALAMAFGKMQLRDKRLFEVLGDALVEGKGRTTLEMARLDELVAIVHAFTKAHQVHSELFRTIMQLIFERFDEMTMPLLVRFVHSVGKVEYILPLGLQQRLADTLAAQDVTKVGIFELLKVAVGARRLGLAVPALEQHVSSVLPHEYRSADSTGQSRRRHEPKKHRQSARKRKWTW